MNFIQQILQRNRSVPEHANDRDEQLWILREALTHYASPDMWATTSVYGKEKRNRWLGVSPGFEVATTALAALEKPSLSS